MESFDLSELSLQSARNRRAMRVALGVMVWYWPP